MKINQYYFEKWVLNSLSPKSYRHLFFNFNERFIKDLLNLYNQSGSIKFLPSDFNLWIFSNGESDKNYLDKGIISRINDADLIEIRNLSEKNSFIVFISNLSPVIIPSDNITSVSEKYYDSHKRYIEYICLSVFLNEYNFNDKIINELKHFIFEECKDNLDYCFYKQIDPTNVLEFFGILGNQFHLNINSFNSSIYKKDFIDRVVDILNKESYIGLEKRLANHNVSNYSEAIEEFKNEGFNSAKDLARNINDVFLKSTVIYKALIDVDEWIKALRDEKEDYSIEFDNKNNNDLYSISKVNGILSDKNEKYILRRENLHAYLSSNDYANWFINNESKGKEKYVSIEASNELIDIKSIVGEDKKTIRLINYAPVLTADNILDFGVKVKERYGLSKKLKIALKKESNIIKDASLTINSILFDKQTQQTERSVVNNLDSYNTNVYEIKDSKLFENSDLDLSFRFVDKATNLEVIILEDEIGEYKINYQNRNEIEIKSIITANNFKDTDLFLQNISFNKLYIKISNNGISEWLIFIFSPEGTKEPLYVKNYFQKYQALNDSSLKKRVITIESRVKNDIHSYYFEDKYSFKETFLPTIFNFDGDYNFVNNNKSNPYFLDTILFKLDLEFRPSRSNFDLLMLMDEFKEYLTLRSEISEWYKNKFLSYDVRSIDDIDYSSDDIFILSCKYLKIYQNLLLLNENTVWIDTFYLCSINPVFNRLEKMPNAVFFSPYNPLLIYQLASRMRLMRNTLENIKKPNSISSLLKRNIIECWVLKVPTQQETFFSIETDSILFTGFVSEKDLYENTLEPILNKFNVSFSQGIGHLSSSQIKSALNKSYSYLSNKSTFNIKLEGELTDNSANDSILEWIETKNNELNQLYSNFILQINIYDNRAQICYPNDNLLSYYKEEKNLNFNWYKGVADVSSFDLTLITSFIPDVSTFIQDDPNSFSNSFSFKNLINANLTSYYNNAIYKDLFVIDSKKENDFDELLINLKDLFKRGLTINQTRTLINNSSFKDSEVVAISSDVSNTFILEEVVGKTLWEFSISDYSYKDNGRGDYFLLANEQEVYTSNFKKFLTEIDPKSINIFEKLLTYSKKTGLFELKHLISNQNFIKGFIASVSARKIIDNLVYNSEDTFIIPYDVFKNRLHKIKLEIEPKYKESGTQYPDFILVQLSKEKENWVIDLRFIEIKYRNNNISESEISKILTNQTSRIKKIFCTLNSWRTKSESEYGLWVNTFSIILTEMSQYYFNNTLKVNNKLKLNFAEAINDDYLCRINDSMLISVDDSNDVKSGTTPSGIYIKIPQSMINRLFEKNEAFEKSFNHFFKSMVRKDICEFEIIRDNEFEEEDEDVVDIENDIFNYESSNVNISKIDHDVILPSENNESSGNIQDVSFPLDNYQSNRFDKTTKVNTSIELHFRNLDVVFGKDNSNRDVIYYPKGKGNSPLPNYNIMVTGSSGKGKTQFIKSFVFQQGRKETSFTIIDFKNDYSDNQFCDLCNLKKVSVKLQGIPYNPLIPRLVKDEDSGSKYYDVSEHINGICSVLGSTFRLGDQQEAQLKRAVREVFKLSGLETRGTLIYEAGMSFPTFNEIGDYLDSGDKDLEKLYNRLDPLFDLNLFPDKYKDVGFENIINESYIIKVSDIQNDNIKNAIAKLIVVSAHGYYLGSEHKPNVSKYFVFDEAHRILDSAFVEKFIRECRAFGVGVLLSSQQPDDFPDDVLGQLATKIIHGNEGIAKLTKKIKDLISFSQDDSYINNLQTFEAIVNNQDYNNFIIKTLAWPHLMVLEAIKGFPTGISLLDLNNELKEKGVNEAQITNLLNTLVNKNYIKNDQGFFKLYS
jgi:hypothetical protein